MIMNEVLRNIIESLHEVEILIAVTIEEGNLFTGWYEDLIQTKKCLLEAKKHIEHFEGY